MVNGESGVRGLSVQELVAVAHNILNGSVTILGLPTMDGTALGSTGSIDCAIENRVKKMH
jgi:hypothetical protein